MNVVARHPHYDHHDAVTDPCDPMVRLEALELYRQHVLLMTKSNTTTTTTTRSSRSRRPTTTTTPSTSLRPESPFKRAKHVFQRLKIPIAAPRKKQSQQQQFHDLEHGFPLKTLSSMSSSLLSLSRMKQEPPNQRQQQDKHGSSPTKPSRSTSSSSLSASSPHQVVRRMSTSHMKLLVKKRVKSSQRLSPQDALDQLVTSNGYSIERLDPSAIKASVYRYKKPTSYQCTSFHPRLLKLIETNDMETLTSLLEIGLSPNPYNRTTGEYLIHYLCHRMKYWNVIQLLIAHGGSNIIQRCDIYGRTPLHILCMNSNHKTAEGGPISSPELAAFVTLLLDYDASLLYVTDCRHATPLSYITKKELYAEWIQFIQQNQSKYFPIKKQGTDDVATTTASTFTSQPIKCARRGCGTLTLEIISLLASGKMDPEEVHCLKYDHHALEDEQEEEEGTDVAEEESDNDIDVIKSSDAATTGSNSNITLETLLLDLESETTESHDDDDGSCDENNDDCSFGADEMAELLESLTTKI
jgi:Ankyrin repeats (many copies)